MSHDGIEDSYSFSLDHQMANNLLPPIQRPHEDVNTIVSLKTEAEKPEAFEEEK